MPQLSLYMDEPTMEGLRRDAAREGKTLSKFVAGDLYGACDDDTFVEPPEIPWEFDAPRKTL